MNRREFFMAAVAAAAALAVDVPAQARGRSRRRRSAREPRKRRKPPAGVGFHGRAVRADEIDEIPLGRPSGRISLFAVHFDEHLDVELYNASGDFDDEALAALDHAFRCRRTGNERAVDPRLYEILSHVCDRVQRRVTLVSGFRDQANEKSRHYHASAMDIRVPDMSVNQLFDLASSLDRGGMGVGRYPGVGFVHLDFRAPGAPSYRWTDYGEEAPRWNRRMRRHRRRPRSRHRHTRRRGLGRRGRRRR